MSECVFASRVAIVPVPICVCATEFDISLSMASLDISLGAPDFVFAFYYLYDYAAIRGITNGIAKSRNSVLNNPGVSFIRYFTRSRVPLCALLLVHRTWRHPGQPSEQLRRTAQLPIFGLITLSRAALLFPFLNCFFRYGKEFPCEPSMA